MKKSDTTSNFAKLTGYFFTRWRLSLVLWACILGFGALTYTTFIKREGFPPIQFPVTFVSGSFNSVDKDVVDSELAQPFYEIVKNIEGVERVQTTAFPQQFTAAVFFESDVDASEGTQNIQDGLDSSDALSEEVKAGLSVITINPASFLNRFDMLVSVYSTEEVTVDELEEVAEFVAKDFSNAPLITEAEVVPLQITVPETGDKVVTNFNRIGIPKNGELEFFQSIVVGVSRDKEQIDVIELSALAQERIDGLDIGLFGDNFEVVIGSDFAESVNTQISSLESNLLSGLIAVAAVSFLLITWRASIITGLFMVSVVLATIAILYLVGYTLNTITLFGLVLALGLFVDDATIVVESIDAHKKRRRKPLETVKLAVAKIGSASFAGTFTTVLVFLPLAFLSGVLGEFIRLMPVTVIIALVTSLVLSLTLIPVLSRFVLLRTDHVSWVTRVNPLAKAIAWAGRAVGDVPRLLKTKRKKGLIVASSMVLVTIGSIMVAFQFAARVDFNIFPPSKDSIQIGYNSTYPPGYTIEDAKQASAQIDEIVATEIGPLIERVTYGSFSITQPNNRSSDAFVELVPFTQRQRKAPEIVDTLQRIIDEQAPEGVSVKVLQYDAGPPATDFPFMVQVQEEDELRALELATLLIEFIDGAEITRPNGTTASITETKLENTQSVARVDGVRQVQVVAGFDADDTSALLVAAQELVEDKFTEAYLVENGFAPDALGFDFGQESENADSFASLAFAFPIALLLMYILLVSQFRSFLQPLLIFMAIPFTFLGVFAGLYYSDNSLSFFVQVGLIGLIGIAVNNTILLTTYANQERRAGERSIDAISNALTKRFRPLVATTLTTVVALLPLALTDPFWEPLAFTIIFGLVSSTFFVLIAFPYYFLAAEWLRMRLSKGTRQARKKAKSRLRTSKK